jgi:hypothetical protein
MSSDGFFICASTRVQAEEAGNYIRVDMERLIEQKELLAYQVYETSDESEKSLLRGIVSLLINLENLHKDAVRKAEKDGPDNNNH